MFLPMFQTHSAYAQRHELKGLMYLGHLSKQQADRRVNIWFVLGVTCIWLVVSTPLKNISQLG
jgi:hypothetical protein